MSEQRPSRIRLDPAVDMMRRIERLERLPAHPSSTVGLTTSDVGEIEPTDPTKEGVGWKAETTAVKFFVTVDEDVVIPGDVT